MSREVLGRYQIAHEVGRGGMSVVYKAKDPRLERTVAVKVLHPHLASRSDSRERFTREARAVARLRHNHIVEVHDYAPPESDEAYIVTEFIGGPTLRVFAEEHPIRHSEVAALLMVPILEALAHAHEAGIVHRDVKPENIMLRDNGLPVLMDFGIAQMVEMDTLTATGTMLGSPAHMAPEVVDGDEVGTQADVFSAGTVLYWLVCGALPFSGPNPAALFRRILECKFDPVLQRRPQAGRSIARLIDQSLARDPKLRPPGAMAVASTLREMLATGGLVDVEDELAAFYADPEVYQDELGRRLVPRYIAAARLAYEGDSIARALGHLDRALAIDDDHPEALALLARIERGKKQAALLRGFGVGLAAVAAIGLVMWLWPASIESEADAGTLAVTTTPDAARSKTVMIDASLDAQLVDAAVPDAAVVDAKVVDAKVKDAEKKIAVRRPKIRPVRVEKAPDAAVVVAPPVADIPITLKSGKVKSWQVSLDAVDLGSIVQYEDGSLKVAPGKHRLTFNTPYCKSKSFRFEARRGAPPRTFAPECQFLPAQLELKAKNTVDVRDDKGRVIGKTNRMIKLPMQTLATSVTLTIGDPRGRFKARSFKVSAGQLTKASVNF